MGSGSLFAAFSLLWHDFYCAIPSSSCFLSHFSKINHVFKMSLECPPVLPFLVLALFYHFSGKGKEIIIYTSGWSFHATTQFVFRKNAPV